MKRRILQVLGRIKSSLGLAFVFFTDIDDTPPLNIRNQPPSHLQRHWWSSLTLAHGFISFLDYTPPLNPLHFHLQTILGHLNRAFSSENIIKVLIQLQAHLITVLFTIFNTYNFTGIYVSNNLTILQIFSNK